MFPIHFKLTIGTVAQLQRLTAFLEQDTDQALAASPRLPGLALESGEFVPADKLGETKQAPGKPSAATTARSQRTAEAGPSSTAPSDAAPEKSTVATKPAADAASAGDKPVAYADLQKAVLTLHKMDPQAAVPIAKALGADTFKLLPDSKWAEALAKVNEAIEARKAA